MKACSVVCGMLAILSLGASQIAGAQGASKPAGALSEQDLKTLLIWNSPWEGRTSAPGQLYSYRTIFRARQQTLIAEVLSYSTHQKSDSVVVIQDGGVQWQDSNGAEVRVAVGDSGDLVGTATNRNSNLPIVLKPRP